MGGAPGAPGARMTILVGGGGDATGTGGGGDNSGGGGGDSNGKVGGGLCSYKEQLNFVVTQTIRVALALPHHTLVRFMGYQ